MRIIVAAALALVAITATASAKKAKVDFTPFEGTYTGSYLITANGQSYFAPVNVKVSVPKSGRVLTLTPSGVLSAGSMSYPIAGSLTLGSGKKAQLANVFFLPTLAASFGTGTFSGKKKNFKVVIVSQITGQTLVSTGNLAFNGKSLSLTLFSAVDSTSTYSVTITAKRKR
jgi:hypothetical protein